MTTIVDMLYRNNQDDNRIVLTTLSGDYTVKSIHEKVDFYIELLKDVDVVNKKVGLMVPMIPSYIGLVLAVNKLGGTVLPISWQFRKEDLSSVLEYLDPHIIFAVKELNGFPFGNVVVDWANKLQNETTVYLTSFGNENWEKKTYGVEPKPIDTAGVGFICTTSGSTGTPKGMLMSSNTLDFSFMLLSEYTDVKSTDKVFLNSPPTHLFGIASLLYGLYSGAHVVFPESFELPKMVKLMADNNCNKIFSTPSIFKAIYSVAKEITPDAVNNIELVGLTGEMVAPDYPEQFKLMKDCRFVTMYGTTEAGGMAHCDMGGEIVFTLHPQIDYKVQDGELTIKSPSTIISYYKNPELTKEIVDENGWLYTGDVVREVEYGRFAIIGRKKDMIKKGGQQVIPGEIERLLMQHGSVKQVVVLGAPHAVLGEQVIAFVISDGEEDAKELSYFCSQRVAGYKVPDQIRFIKEVPMVQGKVDKITLRKMYLERVES